MVAPVCVSPARIRALDRRGPAVLRQQRGVDVDGPETRGLQQGVGQDPAVGGDDGQVGLVRCDLLPEVLRPEPLRLEHRDAVLRREALDRGRADPASPAPRPVRSGDGGDDAVRGVEQALERRQGEGGSSEEDGLYHFPVRCSLWILRTISSRLSPRSRSRNSEPSR